MRYHARIIQALVAHGAIPRRFPVATGPRSWEHQGGSRLAMIRRMVGTAGGLVAGTLIAMACVSSAEGAADGAAPGNPDGGPLTTFVAHALRGEYVPPDVDDVEHMCALLTGCGPLPLPPNLLPADFPSCVKRYTEEMTEVGGIAFSLTMRECGLAANSCASLRSCARRGASPDACAGRGKQGLVGFCDVDGRALTCWQGQIVAVRDCPRGKEQCLVRDAQATCTLGSCGADILEGGPARCSGSGTHLLHCEKGKLESLDCAAFGLGCLTESDGTSECATGGPVCSSTARRCEGNTSIGCFNGREVRVDCGAANLECSLTPGEIAVGACVSPPPTAGRCDPREAPRCDGASIHYCLAGKPRSYLCGAAGFGKCDSSRTGPNCAF
jgi:hypothetical protein